MKKRKLIVSDRLAQAVLNGHYISEVSCAPDFDKEEMIAFLKELDCSLFLTDMEVRCLNLRYGFDQEIIFQNDIREMLGYSDGRIRYAIQEGLSRLQRVLISKYKSENYYELVLTKNLGFSVSVYQLFGVNRKYELFLDKFIHTDIHHLAHIKVSDPEVYFQMDDVLQSLGCRFEHDFSHYTLDELKELLYINDLMPHGLHYLIARNIGEKVLLKDFLKYPKEEILQFDGVGHVKFQQILQILHSFGFYFDYEVPSFINFKSEYERMKNELIYLQQQERDKMEQIEKLFASLDEYKLKIKQKELEIFHLQEEYKDDEDVKRFLIEKKYI